MSDEDSHLDADYDGVQWIGEEAFYQSRKQRKKLTREDHLYGVFAEDEKSSFPQKAPKFTNSTEFVSSGVYQPGMEGPSKNNDVQVTAPKPSTSEPEKTEEKEEALDALPTSFGEKIKEGALRRRNAEKEQEAMKKAWKDAGSTGFAAFEKHSRGVASKLMQKMGYKPGEGLGVRKQGMVEPIVHKLRPKSMGMGYGDSKEQGPERDLKTEDLPQTPVKSQKKDSTPRFWKQKTSKERNRRQFKTSTEVLLESEQEFMETRKQSTTIIDMRTSQTKLLTDLSQLGDELDDRKPLPELEHNMELLIDLTETEIRALDSNLKSKEDSIILLEKQKVEFSVNLVNQTKRFQRLNEFHQEIQKLHNLNNKSDLESLFEACLDLKIRFKADFIQYNIPALILQTIIAHFEALFDDWHPLLDDNSQILKQLKEWKEVLDVSKIAAESEDSSSSNAYIHLLIHAMLPTLRSAIVNEWNPKMPETLLRFLENWRPLMPTLVLRHVCEVLIYPKLKEAVENWDPCEDQIALHVWIHPWLVLMNQQLLLLYPMIVTKFINALQSWHASDSSALVLLSPWKCVFSEKDWDNIFTKAILPKLAQALQQYEVNPLNHDLEVVKWVLRWIDVIPQQHLVNLLDSIFFPKWLRVLHRWLEHNPDFEEVSNWYVSWKSLFPEEMQKNVKLASRFNCALNLMNTAVEGRSMPSIDRVLGLDEIQRSARPPMVRPTPKNIFTLRDLVQRFAEDNNISFLPKPGRMHDGLQVYGFGLVSVALDNAQNTVRAQIGGSWKPVSLEELFTETRHRTSAQNK